MIPLLKKALWALLWDENSAKRQLRGAIGVLAVSGAVYADQVAALFPGHLGSKLALAIRVLGIASAFAVAAHGDETTKPEVAP